MTGQRFARLSLRLDAVYCVVLGMVVAASAPFASESLALPPLVLAVLGLGTSLWGGYVWMLSRAEPLRTRTRIVMIANILASAALGATGLFAGTTVLSIAALVIAIDVAAFAVSQGVALRRLAAPGAPNGNA